jgi:hypothetical protein
MKRNEGAWTEARSERDLGNDEEGDGKRDLATGGASVGPYGPEADLLLSPHSSLLTPHFFRHPIHPSILVLADIRPPTSDIRSPISDLRYPFADYRRSAKFIRK